jgi:hypothetical protein
MKYRFDSSAQRLDDGHAPPATPTANRRHP